MVNPVGMVTKRKSIFIVKHINVEIYRLLHCMQILEWLLRHLIIGLLEPLLHIVQRSPRLLTLLTI